MSKVLKYKHACNCIGWIVTDYSKQHIMPNVSQNRKRNFISKMKAYHGGNKYNLSYELFLYIVEQDKFIQAKQCEIERLRRMIDDLEGCEEYTGPIIEETASEDEFDFD
mgnify:CR=1 FL=1